MTRHRLERFVRGALFGVAPGIPIAASMDGPALRFIFPIAGALIGAAVWGLLRSEESGAGEVIGDSRRQSIAMALLVGGLAAFAILGVVVWAARSV